MKDRETESVDVETQQKGGRESETSRKNNREVTEKKVRPRGKDCLGQFEGRVEILIQ